MFRIAIELPVSNSYHIYACGSAPPAFQEVGLFHSVQLLLGGDLVQTEQSSFPRPKGNLAVDWRTRTRQARTLAIAS